MKHSCLEECQRGHPQRGHPGSSWPPTSHRVSVPPVARPSQLPWQAGKPGRQLPEIQGRAEEGPGKGLGGHTQEWHRASGQQPSDHTACKQGPRRCPPCFPSFPTPRAPLTVPDNGIGLLPGAGPLVINARKFPAPARFIKLPVAGCRARDLAHQELNLPDKAQKRSRSQGDTTHQGQCTNGLSQPRSLAAPARNQRGASCLRFSLLLARRDGRWGGGS